MANGKTKIIVRTVDEYLASLPEKERETLEKLRAAIKSIVPDSTEEFSYQIAVVKHGGKPLVGFGASRGHCSFYAMSSTVIPAFAEKLKDYDTSVGTIRFPAGRSIPSAVVKAIVRARLEENEKSIKKK